jgi:hypothetical protein
MPRNLTGKQAKFAVSVAMGKSLADSYREAYEPVIRRRCRSIQTRAERASARWLPGASRSCR